MKKNLKMKIKMKKNKYRTPTMSIKQLTESNNNIIEAYKQYLDKEDPDKSEIDIYNAESPVPEGNLKIFDGTSGKGYINASYYDLVDKLGEPILGIGDPDKVRAQWFIDFANGNVATIYDWKETQPLEMVTRWFVGAKSHSALDDLQELLDPTMENILVIDDIARGRGIGPVFGMMS